MRRKKSAAMDPEIADLERQRDTQPRDIRDLQIEHELVKTTREQIKRILAATCRA